MNMFKKAQGATEYLIILAIVIIIALIVIGVIGGIPGIGTSASSRASASFWASQDVALTDYAISAAGADTVIVKNNLKNAIDLTVVSVNSVDVEAGTSTLGPGGSKTYSGAVAACTAGQSFSYDVTITYTDKKTGASYTSTGGGVKLEGTCAN
jgi:hypothetical protein